MNILQVISKLDTGDGACDVIASTRFLVLNGHKIVVASQKSASVRKIDEVGARHYALGLVPNIFLIPAAIFKLSQVIRKEDIRIVHARCPLSSFIAFFASRLTERAFVTTVYDNDGKGFAARAQFWAKRIICFSESAAQRLMKDGVVRRDKIRVIPPFVSMNEFHSGSGKPSTPGVDTGKTSKYFTVGAKLQLSSHEATENFIKTISVISRTIHRMRVFLVDSAPRQEKRDVEKFRLLVRRYSLGSVLTLMPREKASEFLSGLDLLIQLDADGNTSPKLLLQAWMSGIPVVTTHAEWIRDYARDNRKAFLAPPTGDPNVVAQAVIGLYKDEKLKKEMVSEAEKLLRQEYSVKNVMESTLNLYEEVASSVNILVIKIGALGDAILAVPSLRAIREKFPKAKVKILVGINNREVFENSSFVDDIIVCDFKGRDAPPAGLLRLTKRLRAEDFDISVDFQNNKKSHMLAFLSCVPKRYGYDNGKLSFLLNRKIRDSGFPVDPVEHQLRVLNLLGIYKIDKKLELWPSKEDRVWADNFLESHWLKESQKIIALNIGASTGWVTKLWPPEYFADVCNKLARNFGIRVLLIGLEKDRPRVGKFLKRARCKPIDALGRTSIPRLASLVKRCDLLLSSDSAPLHVAASVGTPFVALFGPTDPRKHLVPAEREYVVLKKDLKCSPCYHRHCKRRHKCMRSIKPDEVYEAIVKILGIKQ
ncbi:MAG: lipopolysaccharide heptosyltransferase II [Candidatus Omnitrophota bacterium]